MISQENEPILWAQLSSGKIHTPMCSISPTELPKQNLRWYLEKSGSGIIPHRIVLNEE
jgi:hypothetical protein